MSGLSQRGTRPSSNDAGSAMVEFVMLVGPLMIPLVLLIVALFETQRTAFAAVEGARQAGRAYVTASGTDDAEARALYAANLAFVDQGLPPLRPEKMKIAAPRVFCRGATVTVTLEGTASLPMLPKRLASFAVTASHTENIDQFQNLPPCG